jgi:hypothetical protein
MQATMTECLFTWDEPAGCSSPRGWLVLDNHPNANDRNPPSRCCGFYLAYGGDGGSQGPNGEPILAQAYIVVDDAIGVTRRYALGTTWHHDVESARDWCEGNVRAYFGLPRECAA